MEGFLKRGFLSFRRCIAPTHFEVVGKRLELLAAELAAPVRVLDIGAGSAWYWRSGILGRLVNSGKIELSILEPASEDGIQKELRVNRIAGFAPNDLKQFDEGSFHVVMAFDVIEHLPKDQGYLLMYEMERLSCSLAIVFTPNGWVWQPPSTNNPFNAHVSGWRPKEFQRRGGWIVSGHHGPKWAFGPYGIARSMFTNNFIGAVALELLASLIGRLPSRAYAFLAISAKEKRRSAELQPDVRLASQQTPEGFSNRL